jgi:hypothetical protein
LGDALGDAPGDALRFRLVHLFKLV